MNLKFVDITGADRGFNVGSDVLTVTADGHSLKDLWEELQSAISIWNSGRSAIAGLFTFDTTKSSDLLPLDGNRVDLESASEFGVPQARRVTPGYFPVAYDLNWYDTASRFTRKFLRDASAKQISSIHIAMQEADNRLIFNKVLSAVTTPTGGSFGQRGSNEKGETIFSLYAGASDDKPPTAPDGSSFLAGHSHFLVSGSSTVDSEDLDDLIRKVAEHGRGLRSSGENLIVLVNKQESDVIRRFRVESGDMYDFIVSATEPAYLTNQVLVGDRPAAKFNGLDVLGSYGDALIVQHPLMKAGYMVAVASGGDNVLGFRQHPESSNHGFRLVRGQYERYPLLDSVYERGFGVGVRNREAAAVIQIKASGEFTAPEWS